jgi:fructose-bisphosphate aldolase class II
VTSSETLNAALRGFAEAGSDGIVQLSTGGAEFASGAKVKDMVSGAVVMAKFARRAVDGRPGGTGLRRSPLRRAQPGNVAFSGL